MHSIKVSSGLVASIAASALGCQSTPAAQQYAVDIQVESDPGKPLAGAKIISANHELGQTGADGHLRLPLSGPPGEVAHLRVGCPSGFDSPEQPLAIALRALLGESALPHYHALCPPLSRTLVVAVRAKNGGADIPLLHQGREIARTDADGTAHALLTVQPAEHISLALDTSAPSKAALLPHNPEFTMVMPGRDEVAVFAPSFTAPAAPQKKIQRHAAQALGPKPILPGAR